MELLPFVDILKVFNNPINEEQAWAVCYQCVNFLFRSQKQEYYQFVYEYGIHSIWLNRQGDVLLRKMPPDGSESGKGSPHNQHSLHGSTSNTDISKRKRHLIATEMDAVQALGTAIFEALDYGIDPSEERQLSQELESLIVTMTNADNSLDYDPDAQNADDEGIEKDADVEHRCTVLDVIRLCGQHLSSKQDAQHHYKAVCRALATEAGELFTFLDKIATCKEKLSETKDEDARRLEELRRADWACLWVQVMRSLRQGVCLKKVEHVSLPPLEYELTPFEMLLEDIRSRRYTLHKIMVNGEIPHKVKDNAHAVILDFIRSRPPLKKVNDRKLKPKPPPQPDPHERLLKDIRSRPKLRPVRSGRLVVDTSGARLGGGDEPELSQPAKRVIKPDLSLLLNNSFEESSDDDDHSSGSSQMSSPVSAAHSKMSTPLSSWQRSASKDAFLQDSSSHRPTKLQRRHTIMVCDSSMDGKVAPQELPPLEEEEEPSPVRESHQFSSDSIPRQAHGSAVLSRTSFSDNDLPNQVTLRYPQGHPRRYSLEHRRSLTSMNTGLCAIPEMEDSQGGTDSPTKSSGAMLRSWSHEQAPPPNPSPPCKGRARAALGMSLAGMKSVGGPYHPGAHRPHAGVPSALTSYNPSTRHTSSGMTTDSVHTSLAAHYFQHTSVTSSKHAQPACTPSLSSSISTSSYSSSHIPSLDPTASSQSPGYRRKLVMPQGSAGQTKTSCDNSQQHEHYNDRWRRPIGRQGKLNTQQRQDATEDDVFDCVDSSLDHQQSVMSTEEARSRRLSLDSRVGLYKDRHEQLSGTAEFEDTHKPSRRLSLGAQRNIRGVDVTHRRVRTIEEEERLSRLKMLHEESLTPRTRRVGRDMNNQQLAFTTEPAKHVPQQYSQQHNIGASLPDLSNENMDIFQQISASEEARFARWRKLEETGGFTVPLEEDLKKLSPVEKEYVKDILSARLQTSAPVKSAESGSSMAPGVLPLPKRWQNPVECLGLTLEEVTHIRSVLTKAELESLISHPDLYQQVSKSKLCFTCKTTRFSLFGEWGTKCKFCKRTVCSKCLRKMNVPDDQFKHIPVYTLSPVPLTAEMQEVVHTLTKTSSTPSVQLSQGSNISRTKIDVPEQLLDQRPQLAESVPSLDDDAKVMKGFFTRSKPLQRSQSLVVPGHRSSPGIPRTAKGPAMAICCDCKGMVKEIIRATQASLAVLSSPGSSATVPTSSIHPTSTFGTLTNSSV